MQRYLPTRSATGLSDSESPCESESVTDQQSTGWVPMQESYVSLGAMKNNWQSLWIPMAFFVLQRNIDGKQYGFYLYSIVQPGTEIPNFYSNKSGFQLM